MVSSDSLVPKYTWSPRHHFGCERFKIVALNSPNKCTWSRSVLRPLKRDGPGFHAYLIPCFACTLGADFLYHGCPTSGSGTRLCEMKNRIFNPTDRSVLAVGGDIRVPSAREIRHVRAQMRIVPVVTSLCVPKGFCRYGLTHVYSLTIYTADSSALCAILRRREKGGIYPLVFLHQEKAWRNTIPYFAPYIYLRHYVVQTI